MLYRSCQRYGSVRWPAGNATRVIGSRQSRDRANRTGSEVFRNVIASATMLPRLQDVVGGAMAKDDRNRLYYGDNLDVLRRHIDDASVDLIYLDPPFNSNRSYNVLFKHKSGEDSQAQIEAFDDTWTWSHEAEAQYEELINGGAPIKVADAMEAMRRILGENDVLAYLVMMTSRLVELHRVLKPTGSLYLHCDPTASHYLKLILDSIFGLKSYRNEIIWKRTMAHSSAKKWAPVHDVILYYSRGATNIWNAPRKDYDQEYLDRYYKYDDGDGRLYWRNSLTAAGIRNGSSGRPWRGIDVSATGQHWKFTTERLDELDLNGRIYWPPGGKGFPQIKRYRDELSGVAIGDIWDDIDRINPVGHERLGYPTQKPVALLERILRASSSEGDVVLDPFCGCGTTIDAAQKLGRRWQGIDITYLAVDLIEKRLRHSYGDGVMDTFTVVGIPRDVEAAEALFHRSPFEFERWAVSLVDGQPNEKQVGDRGIDGVIRFHADGKGSTDRIIVSVKGGRQLGPQMVRDLAGAVASQRAAGGLLITLTPPTRGMVEAANHAGLFRHVRHGKSYPKIQLANVGDLLRGKRPDFPPVVLPYIQAKRREAPDLQAKIF